MKFKFVLFSILYCVIPGQLFGNSSSQNEAITQVYRFDEATIIDWDDTLLPTSFIQENLRLEDSYEHNLERILKLCPDEWKEFDSFIANFLIEVRKTSNLYVISSAEVKWIKMSSSTLMPKTSKILGQIGRENRLISAKEFFFRWNPIPYVAENVEKTKLDWKRFTFRHILSNYNKIISLGDSDDERRALNLLPNFTGKEKIKKSIKLLDSPETIELLLSQWTYIKSKWIEFAHEEKTVDLYISEDLNAFLDFE